MSRFESSLSLQGLFSGENRKPAVILLFAPLAILTWKKFGTKAFYLTHRAAFGLGHNPDWEGAIYSYVTALVLFGLIPALLIKLVFGETLAGYGVRLGDQRFGWRAVAVMAPVVMLLAYPTAGDPQFLAEYPLVRGAGASAAAFILHALLYLVYYASYEMFMRGFIQFGLRERFGDWHAILVQVAISALFHLGKPDGEAFSSVLGGLIWGLVVFRSRSLLYVLLTHWLLGVSLDFFICFAP